MVSSLSFLPMDAAGVTNQKIALLGLVQIARQRSMSIRLPDLAVFAPGSAEAPPVPFHDVFDRALFRRYLEEQDVALEDGPAGSAGETVHAWDCFKVGGRLIQDLGREKVFPSYSPVVSFFKWLAISPSLQSVIGTAAASMALDGVEAACQMRIEKDWMVYAKRTLSKRVHRREDYAIPYQHILRKLAATKPFRDSPALYVTVDELQSPVPLAEIAAWALRVLGLTLKSKTDYISGLAALDSLRKSLVDFELAMIPRYFAGQSRSSFSNMLAFTRMARAWPGNSAEATDYVYNAPVEWLMPRIDHGMAVDITEVTGQVMRSRGDGLRLIKGQLRQTAKKIAEAARHKSAS